MKNLVRLRRWHFIVLITALLLPVKTGWAFVPSELASPGNTPIPLIEINRFISRAGLSGVYWTPVEAIRVQGVLFYFSRIRARAGLDAVLSGFTEKTSPFERILFGSNQVLLSGWVERDHWLLHLHMAGNVVEGMLSVLPFDSAKAKASAILDDDAITNDWAQAYSRLRTSSLQEQP